MKPQAIAILAGLIFSSSIFAAPKKDIVDTAVAAGKFETLAAALQAADLIDALKGDGPFTVFAPTDEAFAELPEPVLKALLKPSNKKVLAEILTYHVVAAEVPFSAAVGLEEAKALSGKKIAIQIQEGRLMLNKSKVIANDIKTTNGIIHVIDAVLLPPDLDLGKLSGVYGDSSDLVRNAIHRGDRLWQHGQKEASAAVYDITLQALLQQEGDQLDKNLVQHLTAAQTAKTCGTCLSQHRSVKQRTALQAYLKHRAKKPSTVARASAY